MTQLEALSIMKTGANVFLTGEPGSGKTYVINKYVQYLRECGIDPAVTASTGIAATHISGMTIHSWSGVGIKEKLDKYDLDKISSSQYIAKRVIRTNVLIIDEVSMLSSSTLSMVDAVAREIRHNSGAFGGLQVIFVGDFFQLPPIAKKIEIDLEETVLIEDTSTRFAYDSSAWSRANPIVCYLTEQHRQSDDGFSSILAAIRKNTFGEKHMASLEKRKINKSFPEETLKLFSHNIDVDRINNDMLAKILGSEKTFEMSSKGTVWLVETLKKGCLSPAKLSLKTSAKVMFTKNNLKEGFVNGTTGRVLGFGSGGYPIVQTSSGRKIEVMPMEWMVEENGKARAAISQLPLRLAWAITIHKSQGMNLDEAVMDLENVFEYGQGYVALSRVRKLSSLYLIGWNERVFMVHPEVLAKDGFFRKSADEAEKILGEIPKENLAKLQENFVKACGGKIKKKRQARSARVL
ncbi:hypothetical protein A3I27_00735 [Candidatus Giovannonibacteria bacterium RIFCSPLOWO2_02_FULL_43_11b]|uniref:AAA+ ATPase domain-containing protein n=1 Tax=Candidatus Giovannonibacteria bacterium RIFCSPHIGHO2_12_FULL_43_15 TaxID=1798341 RepID=A0A1F5WPK4_9BACT|nr:MAG: hypothetical protein A3B97_01425 [Candidatus Giovannonibacteria bacterium RIFCSPHIGHO2_02_FULL_43_32]OGF77588.1 MAG: hypothetical protein A3F23_00075 [Candidatus Giovannonibacteria bacterium RIFCSPHIGHO2_12_FULL_43_15]OGF90179.1 MAG: hypothetical protein A3I27_00735 [Candidatus Giovannonibacteria bacterium RIFCSPLOWO2_02_FULL_43_11b]OGF92561.1 MAG: hypothetical protein A3H04_01915 [Candidatus Giovannonibacteria bacterium RIFCSPLOWO2_12_FULL_43_11c]